MLLVHPRSLLHGGHKYKGCMSGMQAAVADCLHGLGAMCQALLAQLKADAKVAVKQALAADGPFELSPQASYLVITRVPLCT